MLIVINSKFNGDISSISNDIKKISESYTVKGSSHFTIEDFMIILNELKESNLEFVYIDVIGLCLIHSKSKNESNSYLNVLGSGLLTLVKPIDDSFVYGDFILIPINDIMFDGVVLNDIKDIKNKKDDNLFNNIILLFLDNYTVTLRNELNVIGESLMEKYSKNDDKKIKMVKKLKKEKSVRKSGVKKSDKKSDIVFSVNKSMWEDIVNSYGDDLSLPVSFYIKDLESIKMDDDKVLNSVMDMIYDKFVISYNKKSKFKKDLIIYKDPGNLFNIKIKSSDFDFCIDNLIDFFKKNESYEKCSLLLKVKEFINKK